MREIPITRKTSNIDFDSVKTFSRKKIYQLIKTYFPVWVTPHSFRRSFCTNLIKSGANIKIISILMGHTKIETTARYIHFDKEDILKEMEIYL